MSDARVIGVEVKHVRDLLWKIMMSSDIGALRRLLNMVEALPRPMLGRGGHNPPCMHTLNLPNPYTENNLIRHGWKVSLLVDELASIMGLSHQR